MSSSYNLIQEPWIPCAFSGGAVRNLGIAEALEFAHEISAISVRSPLVETALERLLIAVLHRVVDGPRSTRDVARLLRAGKLDPERTSAYLNSWRHRFDLFDSEYPFYQVGGLVKTKGTGKKLTEAEPGTVNKLDPGLATGNNHTLFDHSADERPGWRPADWLAQQLVATQTFALGGGISGGTTTFGKHPNFSAGPLVGALSVSMGGSSLFEKLVLNLVPPPDCFVDTGEDAPAWEFETSPPPKPGVRGYLDWLTLQVRYVRLISEKFGGRPGARLMHFVSGRSVPTNAGIYNPTACYVTSKKSGLLPIQLRPERAVWRDAPALLAQRSIGRAAGTEGRRPASVHQTTESRVSECLDTRAARHIRVVGLANKQANPLLVRSLDLPVQLRVLSDRELLASSRAAVKRAEEASGLLGKALWTYCDVLLSSREHPANRDDISRLQGRLRQKADFWGPLEGPFLAFLTQLPDAPTRALASWEDALGAAVRESFTKATTVRHGRPDRHFRAISAAERKLHTSLAAWREERDT